MVRAAGHKFEYFETCFHSLSLPLTRLLSLLSQIIAAYVSIKQFLYIRCVLCASDSLSHFATLPLRQANKQLSEGLWEGSVRRCRGGGLPVNSNDN